MKKNIHHTSFELEGPPGMEGWECFLDRTWGLRLGETLGVFEDEWHIDLGSVLLLWIMTSHLLVFFEAEDDWCNAEIVNSRI